MLRFTLHLPAQEKIIYAYSNNQILVGMDGVQSEYMLINNSFSNDLKFPSRYNINSLTILNNAQVAVACSLATVGLITFSKHDNGVPTLVIAQVPDLNADTEIYQVLYT